MAMRLNPTTGQYEYVSQAAPGQIQSYIAGSPIAGPGEAQSQSSYSPLSPINNGLATTAPTKRPLVITGAENFAGHGGDWNALYGGGSSAAAPTTPPPGQFGFTPQAGGAPFMPGLNVPGHPDNTANNQAVSTGISHLLDPNDAQANYDVTMHGAEAATGRGIPGSGLASETTGRLRQADIERRLNLGSNLVNQQNQLALQDKFQSGQLTLQQAQLMLQAQVQTGQLSIEQARLALDWYRTITGNRGAVGGGSGGGNRNAPLPGAGGGAPSGVGGGQGYGGGINTPTFSLPRGGGNATAPPPIIAPDNWDQMTPQEQQDYAAQYRGDAANYGGNPYQVDEGSWYDPTYTGNAGDQFDFGDGYDPYW